MPLVNKGVYMECNDKAYEVESAYYLNFQIQSALASLAQINSFYSLFEWENRCAYYHYYTDHLLYSLGQISNRFLPHPSDNDLEKERKAANRNNFQYSENEYPLLSDKRARNTIEHIDEHNQKIISTKLGVGGFNLIDSHTEQTLIDNLRARRDVHPYTLDLLRKEIYIRRDGSDLFISLEQLHKELTTLQDNVKYFMGFLTSP